MKTAVLIVAAGRGARASSEIPKQYNYIAGKPLLAWSLDTLAAAGLDRVLVMIAPRDEVLFAPLRAPGVRFVPGGETRTASVRAGLAALAADPPEAVLIHDAARPGLPLDMPARLLAALETGLAGVAPALPAADALKRVNAAGAVEADMARDGLVRVQTPQAFRFAAIADAYARLPPTAALDDDLAVARAAGYAAAVIAGDPRLMKATYPEDFAVLERLLDQEGGRPCVGAGFDAHRFGPGDHVTLCGVRIAHAHGLIGHSDADAGWHALTDAILGALGAGDIGDHFPPSDPRWRGAPSETFLAHAAKLAAAAGARIAHVDVTLICEQPKIAPHRQAMRARTAEVLALPLDRVSVKATTTERMGFTGRGEGLAAQASATLLR
ncbi:MAG: bifunctional 2-C-methyl-D-erythritol 4-phosphate cytidylyltransferase/2-C-methyl-D-erythritol 2,4-cyclodiphosphate synthase [Hyphomonadaceae bacterium]